MKRYSILQRYKSRGNFTWYGRISDGVSVKYVSLNVTRKSDATEWLNQNNARKFLPESMLEEERDKRLIEASNRFLEYICSLRGSGSLTIKAYMTKIRNLTRWAESNGITTLRELTRENASKFATHVISRFSPKTAREVLRVSKQFCSWSSETFEIKDWTPFYAVKSPKIEKRKKDFWTLEQIELILDEAPSKGFRLFWSLMAYAGLRHSEACSFDSRSISEGKLHIIGKGNKESFLPISDKLKKELDRFGNIEYDVLRKPEFLYSRSNSVLRGAVKRAGFDCSGVVNNHRFRHSFASNLIRAGVNVKAVQQLMRHENVQITLDTYSHLLQEDLVDAVNAF